MCILKFNFFLTLYINPVSNLTDVCVTKNQFCNKNHKNQTLFLNCSEIFIKNLSWIRLRV